MPADERRSEAVDGRLESIGYTAATAYIILGSTVDQLDQVLTALRRVIRATDLHSKRLAKESGLTAPQILLLRAIRQLEGAAIGQLAAEVSLSQATVTTIIDRLEKRGYVERQRSTVDKRKVHAHLTDRGIDALRDAPTPLQEHFSRQFNDLQEWEQTMLIAALQRVAHMMDAEHIDASPVLDVGILDRSTEASQPVELVAHQPKGASDQV